MSLERQDVRARLDAEMHAALVALCDVDGVTMAEFIENLLVPVIRERVRAASELHSKVKHLGISATQCDTPGIEAAP